MRTKLFLLSGIVAIVAVLTPTPASAGAPVREFLPAAPFDLDGPCPFVVHAEFPVNNEYTITFTDADGNPTRIIIEGSLFTTLTNTETDESVTLNISGPGVITFGADGSTLLNAWGNWTIFFFPGQLGPGSPGSFILNQGRMEILTAANGFDQQILSQSGKQTDVCALIS
jgi:hypothetical protein